MNWQNLAEPTETGGSCRFLAAHERAMAELEDTQGTAEDQVHCIALPCLIFTIFSTLLLIFMALLCYSIALHCIGSYVFRGINQTIHFGLDSGLNLEG